MAKDKWDWKRLLPIDVWSATAVGDYPTWDKGSDGENPPYVTFAVTKGAGKSSREIAIEFDDLAVGNFYYRDWTDSGLPFVNGGETYRTGFWFQRQTDCDLFTELYR